MKCATDYQPNWVGPTLNFKNSCLHPHTEIGYYNDSAWEPQKPFAAARMPSSLKPPFQIFFLVPQNHKFLENLHFKSLKIEEKFSSYTYHLVKSRRGYFCQNCMWICLLHLENLTFSIPTFSTITHPSVYHFRKKSTQFSSNWVLFTKICSKYTQSI